MKKTDVLHELIQNLKKSEKRHFKLYASAYGHERNYLRLFDALEKQETYNEKALYEQFKGEKFISQLPATKSYLYKLILKSLCDCYTEQSASMQLYDMMKQIAILYYKGLFPQANRILIKAREQAVKHEIHFLMPYIVFWQKKIWLRTLDKRGIEKNSEELNILAEQSLQGMLNTLQYYSLAEKQLKLQRGSGDRKDPEQETAWAELSENPLYSDPERAMTYESLFMFYNLQYIYYAYLPKPDQNLQYHYAQKAYDLIKDQYGRKEEDSLRYIGSLKNLVYTVSPEYPSGKSPASDKINDLLAELESLDGKLKTYASSRYTSHRILSTLLVYQLNCHLEIGEYETLLAAINKHDVILNDIYTRSNRLDVYYSFYTLSYFGTGDFHKALQYLIRLQELPNLPENSALAWRIMNLIIHYELKNYDLIEYQIKSFYRQLLKIKKTFRFEFIVLDFLRKKTLKARNEQELTQAFSSLHKELLQLYEDPREKTAFKYFDLLSWLESKIKQKPFREIVREKAETGNHSYSN